MYKLYQTKKGSRGSLAEVWIDTEAKLVKKYYKPAGITITGSVPYHTSMEDITKLFKNELHWYNKLKSKYVLEIYEYGPLKEEPGYYILQEYVGPDLLYHFRSRENLKIVFPNIVEQIEELFILYRGHNLHKINNAMCNLTGANGKIKAFDFKYATERTDESKIWELHSIDTWISKIDPDLKTILRKYI